MRSWRAALLVLSCCAATHALADWGDSAHADSAPQGYVATFDWLVATNGRHEFMEPLLTLNQGDLERFVPTGVSVQSYVVGDMVIEVRTGVYYSNEEYPDTSIDVPASVQVKLRGQTIVGAKGLYLTTQVTPEHILVEHWNGLPGCTLSRYYLAYEVSVDGSVPGLRLADSEYADLIEQAPCRPE